MIRVRLLTSRVLASGQVETQGDVVFVEPEEAKRLIAAGQAVPMLDDLETGMTGAARETAVLPRAKARN